MTNKVEPTKYHVTGFMMTADGAIHSVDTTITIIEPPTDQNDLRLAIYLRLFAVYPEGEKFTKVEFTEVQ